MGFKKWLDSDKIYLWIWTPETGVEIDGSYDEDSVPSHNRLWPFSYSMSGKYQNGSLTAFMWSRQYDRSFFNKHILPDLQKQLSYKGLEIKDVIVR